MAKKEKTEKEKERAKKVRFKAKRVDKPLLNADFNSPENLEFQKEFCTKYKLPKEKPLVFVPCASGKKGKEGKIGYSSSMSHCFMSDVTKNPDYEKIVLSEPLVMVPYSMENEIPNYNYPPKALKSEDRDIFVDRASKALIKLKKDDPSRKKVYYIGGKHHKTILEEANNKAGKPFDIDYNMLKTGYDHKEIAEQLDKKIKNDLKKGIRN